MIRKNKFFWTDCLEKTSNKRIKSTITLILRISVAAAACVLIFKDLEFKKLAYSFRSLHLWVILIALTVKFFAEIVMAFRWWILLRTLHIFIPFKTALRLHFHGLFFSSFLPGSMGGDFVRAWYVTRHTHKRFQSALSVFVDRVIGLASTLLIAIVSYFLYLRGEGILSIQRTKGIDFTFSQYWEAITAVLGLLAVLGISLAVIPRSRAALKMLFIHIWKNAKNAMLQLRDVLSVFFKKLWLGPTAVGLTVFFQCLTFLSFWLIGRDLGGSDQIRYYFAFFPLVWVIGSIPLSPAGIGILEGGVILLFVTAAGTSQESATALALCQRAIFLVGGLPGIWIHLCADYLPKSKEEFFVDA